jgi:hypothetical protein
LTTLVWTEPEASGCAGPRYDTLRSSDPADFVTAPFCVESDDGLDTSAEDGETPGPGEAYFYLVRAENDCPVGEGPLGEGSGGERSGAACP